MSISAEERTAIFEERWASGGTTFMAAFNDLATNQASNDAAAEFVREKIRAIVHETKTAELLAAKDYPIGTKRICVDTQYFETFNRDNVELIDVRDAPIEKITEAGVEVGGREFEFDAIVFATGFDAMTGTLLKIDIQGRNGTTLAEVARSLDLGATDRWGPGRNSSGQDGVYRR